MDNMPNPYSAPETDADDMRLAPPREVDPDILRHIQTGVVVALACILFTVLTLLFPFIHVYPLEHFPLYAVAAAVLMIPVIVFPLAFGLYKKSRVVATLLFVYYVISRVMVLRYVPDFMTAILMLLVAYFYLRAMLATYAYHRWLKE